MQGVERFMEKKKETILIINSSMGRSKKVKLSGIPTAYEETQKIVQNKDLSKISGSINQLEEQRRKNDAIAILDLVNDINKGKNPMVKMATIREQTYQQALGSLLSVRNTEAFEVMMLLYEHMERKKSFKIDSITGTELLRLSGAKSINQEKRNNKLKLLLDQSAIKIQVLDPERSLKNYQNKKDEKGLVYKIYDLLRIKKVVYSEQNPDLIVRLEEIEFLPEYIEHFHTISKRYIPLESIRYIPEAKGTDKTRHFVYKLCFKLASIKGSECDLNLYECMNLGKFLNKGERALNRKWKPIEKGLLEAKKLGLIEFQWNFRRTEETERKKDNLNVDLFGDIMGVEYDDKNRLKGKFYKYIETVTVKRLYNLKKEQMKLPFSLEKEEPKREQKEMKAEF